MTSRLALLGGEPVRESFPPRQWPAFSDADLAGLSDFVRSNDLSYVGREGVIRELERKFEDYLPAAFAIACSSGTAALHSAYFGVGLQPGDEVLVPAYTYFATVMPLFACNAVPVLVDVDPRTANLDADRLERHVTPRTKAIAVTHNFGFPADMERIGAVARRYRLRVIEDCSHAHGATYRGSKVGTLGDVGVFSLQSKKLVPAGEGGILVTNDREVYERATLLGHPRDRSLAEVTSETYRPFAATGLGLKYRMHPVGAYLADRQFPSFERIIANRHTNWSYLSARLQGIPGIEPPVLYEYMTRSAYYSYHPLYTGSATNGLPIDVFIEALRAEGVPADRPASKPLHLEAAFYSEDFPIATFEPGQNVRRTYRPGDFPGAEEYAARVLRLPPYTEIMMDEMKDFGNAFEKVIENASDLIEYAKTVPLPRPFGRLDET